MCFLELYFNLCVRSLLDNRAAESAGAPEDGAFSEIFIEHSLYRNILP